MVLTVKNKFMTKLEQPQLKNYMQLENWTQLETPLGTVSNLFLWPHNSPLSLAT
jgi:hypothetical protein